MKQFAPIMLAILALVISNVSAVVTITPTDSRIQYFGRVDKAIASQPRLQYSGIGFSTKFTGTSLKITMVDNGWGPTGWIGVYIDSMPEVKLQISGTAKVTAATGLSNTTHLLTVVKRTEALSGYMTFIGMELDDGASLVQPDPRPDRKIECFGNSITAGQYVECPGDSITDNDAGCLTSVQDNGFISYPWQLARMLGADCHQNGLAGLAIWDSTGYYNCSCTGCTNCTNGFNTTWDKAIVQPGAITTWDFTRYTPQVVTFAFGVNDQSGTNFGLQADRDKWKTRYKSILALLRVKYPQAHFILTTCYLSHNALVDTCIKQISTELNSPLVHYYLMSRGGTNGTSGHPKIQNQRAMARELYNYIQTLDIPWPSVSIAHQKELVIKELSQLTPVRTQVGWIIRLPESMISRGNLEARVMDLNGHTICKLAAGQSSTAISLGSMQPGICFIQIRDKGGSCGIAPIIIR